MPEWQVTNVRFPAASPTLQQGIMLFSLLERWGEEANALENTHLTAPRQTSFGLAGEEFQNFTKLLDRLAPVPPISFSF